MTHPRGMSTRHAEVWHARNAWLAAIALWCAVGCAHEPDDSNIVRGRGLQPAALSPADEAGVYDAAARASFNVEPGLVLLIHPQRLPRTAGYDGGDPVSAALAEALRNRGVVRGTCLPKHDAPRDTPRCTIPQAGYVIRGSPVMKAGGDTLQMNFAAEAFAAATGARPQALRFEKIYQLVGHGSDWRVAREARVREQ
jgi:hypothetical protein